MVYAGHDAMSPFATPPGGKFERVLFGIAARKIDGLFHVILNLAWGAGPLEAWWGGSTSG